MPSQSDSPSRTAIYARISLDRSKEAAGVQRQLQEARRYARQHEFAVVAECVDNDISAIKGKVRPGFEDLLDLVRRDKIDTVLVFHTSRLIRNRAERAMVIDLFGRHRVSIDAVKGPSFDLTTAYGRGLAEMAGAFDTMESEVKSERIVLAVEDRWRARMPNLLGYGWSQNGTGSGRWYEIDQDTAEVVRQITKRLLAGEALGSVTRWLNDSGIPAPAAARWGKTSVRKIALRPANAGLIARGVKECRRLKAEARVNGDAATLRKLAPVDWLEVQPSPHIPALVERDDFERVAALLLATSRDNSAAVARPGARKYLLSYGVAVCGKPRDDGTICGARMKIGRRGSPGYRAQLYVCEAHEHLGRDRERVDEWVGLRVTEKLTRPDALDWALGDEEAAQRAGRHLVDLQRRSNEAAEQFALGAITMEQLGTINKTLAPQIEAAEQDYRRLQSTMSLSLLAEVAGPKAEKRWQAITVEQQRKVLEALGTRVTILPTKPGPGFRSEDVLVEFGVS